MEDLDLLIEKMIADGKSDDEIKNAIKDYKAGKLNGAAEKGATATPTPGAPENMVSDSEVFSSASFAEQQAKFNSESALDRNLREIKEKVESEDVKFELNTNVTDQGALNNFKIRTGREATSVMELKDIDYKSPIFDPNKTNVDEELLLNNLKKEKELKIQEKTLEQEISTGDIILNNVGFEAGKEIKEKGKVDLNYIKNELKDLNNNPIFQLQKKALENLKQDSYTTQKTGNNFESATNTVKNVLGLVNINVGSEKEIELTDDVLVSAISDMNQRDLQKLSTDNFKTEEKEAIINNAKVDVFFKKSNEVDIAVENIQKEYSQNSYNAENKLLDIRGQLKILNESFKNPNNKTQEAVSSYNNLIKSYNLTLSKAKETNVFYKNKFNDLKDERDEIASNLNIEIANGILTLPDNFESTKR